MFLTAVCGFRSTLGKSCLFRYPILSNRNWNIKAYRPGFPHLFPDPHSKPTWCNWCSLWKCRRLDFRPFFRRRVRGCGGIGNGCLWNANVPGNAQSRKFQRFLSGSHSLWIHLFWILFKRNRRIFLEFKGVWRIFYLKL
jgi:hypothetical protein